MAGRWNPNDPFLIGQEHDGLGHATSVIDAQSKQIAIRWRAQANGVVDEAHVHAEAGSSSPVVDSYRGIYRPLLVEVLPRASEIAAAGLTLTTFQVNEVVGTVGFTDEAGGAVVPGDFFTDNDGAFAKSGAYADYIDLRFGTAGAGAGALAGRHILQVQFYLVPENILDAAKFRLNLYDSSGFNWLTSALGGGGQNVLYVGEGRCITPAPGGPAAWSHWAPSDIDLFDTTWKLRVYNVNPTMGTTVGIEKLYMTVVHIPERRLAVGLFEPKNPNTWHTVPLLKPDKTGTWARVAGADYTTVIRRCYPWYNHNNNMPVQDASLVHRHVGGSVPDGLLTKHAISTIDGGTFQATAIGPDLGVTPLMRYRAAGVDIPESQAYALQWGVCVSGAVPASQQITTTVTDDYSVMFLSLSADLAPPGDLTVSLRNLTTFAVVATNVISVEDVEEAPLLGAALTGDINNPNGVLRNYHRVVVEWLPLSNLVVGTTYRVELSTVAGVGEANAWLVGALVSETLYEPSGYGGGTLEAVGKVWIPDPVSLGAEAAAEGDLQLVVGAAPDPPTNFHTGVWTQYLDGADDECEAPGCLIGSIEHATIGWSPTTLGVAFARYEIQRRDPYTAEATIAHVLAEATVLFHDYESRIGVPTEYRVRVIRNDGVPSVYTAWSSETVPGKRAELHFTSNERPDLNVAYNDVYDAAPGRDFAFPEAAETTLKPLYGRDYQVAFRPTERRGVSFARRLLVSGLRDTGAAPTLDVFAPLRTLAWQPLAYVCVRDTEGNRWFANVQVPDAQARHVGRRYFATIGVTEVTATPSTPDA